MMCRMMHGNHSSVDLQFDFEALVFFVRDSLPYVTIHIRFHFPYLFMLACRFPVFLINKTYFCLSVLVCFAALNIKRDL